MAKVVTRKTSVLPNSLVKTPTGISGLDEITSGGIPKGRPTLVCGSAGSGKTLMAMEFLVRGATEYGEPGVFMSFEETSQELAQNVASLGFNLDKMIRDHKLIIDNVYLERGEIEETGEYDLEGLFIRLDYAIDSIGAKRVVLDTIEALFAGLRNEFVLRSELRRLFRFLKKKRVTAVVTGERGDGLLTRHGLEEYVSDCVIVLDHRVIDQVATRRLRIVKYRGAAHGTNEYPFLIDEDGLSVIPVTALGLNHAALTERIPTGIAGLDEMLGGKGYYRGSSILISGTAGTGKTSIAAYFLDSVCRRGEKAMFFAFEESESQVLRNMSSVGLKLDRWVKAGRLRFVTARPTTLGLEMHLASIHKQIEKFSPDAVVMDPVTDFESAGSEQDAKRLLLRLVDFLKFRGVTAMMTSLTNEGDLLSSSGISSIIDTWLLVRNFELYAERNRALYILKSRGMAHSNQVREFVLTSKGVDLLDVCMGPDGILIGSARATQQAQDEINRKNREQSVRAAKRTFEQKRAALEARIAAMRVELESEHGDVLYQIEEENLRNKLLMTDRQELAGERTSARGGRRAKR